MPTLSPFPRPAAATSSPPPRSILFNSAWATELINSLSSISLSHKPRRIGHAHSNRAPHFHPPAISRAPPPNTGPPISPASAKDPKDLVANQQHRMSNAVMESKIKVLITIEVITQTEDMTHIRSPSPHPIKPCLIRHVTRRPLLNEDCSICYTNLASATVDDTVWCKGACGNNFHKSCFDEWRTYAPRPLRCVHCRSIWRRSCEHDYDRSQ
ncbi:hypothetical protein E2P81_ATG03237 [Venturia nashicola]|uniref:RING-type domain-containing protein n=1 Tax=Venturia nashicola TaxID=86259 RepID=A0A4Z1P9Q4_9PEZI|nr:hypothetical protein E6O75_ATG03305 [Venturia nashicola]TLD36348.1 hypothetical protein E2P81_ATG03237 [Venturia nashicola]